MGFIWYIIIGIVAGFLAGKVMRGGGFGLIINLLLGILGGVLGGWVFALFGLSAGIDRKFDNFHCRELSLYYGLLPYSRNLNRYLYNLFLILKTELNYGM